MPALPSPTAFRRESWPPTQVRLVRSRAETKKKQKERDDEPRPLLEDIDEDPLTYFLTPTVEEEDDDDDVDDDDDEDEDTVDFDAGIQEVAGHGRRQLIRCVSPSTLEHLGQLRAAGSPPVFDSDGLTSDDDSDDEDCYIRFSRPSSAVAAVAVAVASRGRGVNFSGAGGFHFLLRERSPPFSALDGDASDGDDVFSAASLRCSFTNNNSNNSNNSNNDKSSGIAAATKQATGGSCFTTTTSCGCSASAPRRAGGRQGRLWREPSAHVWSIEEETEEDVRMSETRADDCCGGSRSSIRTRTGVLSTGNNNHNSNKPIKRVRFVLPDEQ